MKKNNLDGRIGSISQFMANFISGRFPGCDTNYLAWRFAVVCTATDSGFKTKKIVYF